MEFICNEEYERSFQKIKEYLCSSPILAIYDQNKEIFIYTDASGDGLWTVLKQPQDNGMLHQVVYFSRELKPKQNQRRKQSISNALPLKKRFNIYNITHYCCYAQNAWYEMNLIGMAFVMRTSCSAYIAANAFTKIASGLIWRSNMTCTPTVTRMIHVAEPNNKRIN